jgi:hypothetical protein
LLTFLDGIGLTTPGQRLWATARMGLLTFRDGFGLSAFLSD